MKIYCGETRTGDFRRGTKSERVLCLVKVNMSDGHTFGDEQVGPIICEKPSVVHVAVEELVNMSDGQIVGDERVGPITCGKQSVCVVDEAFGAEDAFSILDQEEQAALTENLLQGGRS